ncbi:DUF1493 family protein [Pseudomonas sp. DOAB1067]|uniref:DUF1493 family protein n=1 Tax=Pseudomonas triticifolii TaxID=2762592 RepID=A0ABR7BE25_9PSED|nr:DUF1493 family protein [Pseudomonas triticifolii]MBC3954895.1 DUF1493 family protein [Pseudomonas triticifolii]
MGEGRLDRTVLNYLVEKIFFFAGFGRNAFETLNLATQLSDDLGLDGEDANDLMADFFEHFNVAPGDYDHYRYFKPEGTDVFVFFRPRERRAGTPMTLGMLCEAARMKAWDCQLLEAMRFSSAPVYSRTEDIPVEGFKIRTR